MAKTNFHPAEVSLNTAAGQKTFIDLPLLLGERLPKLPHVLRLLIENHVRTSSDTTDVLVAVDAWLEHKPSSFEFLFTPNRILMHDTTCTPALADLAAMRDVVADAKRDPHSLAPKIPVDVCIDHSVAVDKYATNNAIVINQRMELDRNTERYAFMKWAALSMDNLTVYPPGSGIMHTINLEQLASIVVFQPDGFTHPDMMLGTDSHTPMINGIGVLGWGVGGLEAESVMLGQAVSIAFPSIVGVELTGALNPGTLATDLALEITNQLRKLDVTGCFVEFFGPGLSTLSADERSVIANMAPEYGASTGFFPVDNESVSYLSRTARDASLTDCIEPIFRAQGLWFDPKQTPKFDRRIKIQLDLVNACVAGPTRPQDTHPISQVMQALEENIKRKLNPDSTETVPDGAVGVAAITSCTNTSAPSLLIAAGLFARNARAKGLKPPVWVKTSLAPGSTSAGVYLKRAGLLDDLAAIGFDIVGYGCTTCIGNSGSLPELIEEALEQGKAVSAVISGNRNFPGRVHPKLDLCFLASPPLVIAYALKGQLAGDITADPIGYEPNGNPVYLRDLWPSETQIQQTLSECYRNADVPSAFTRANDSAEWHAIEASDKPCFPWNANSIQLRPPKFVSAEEPCRLGRYSASPLLVLGDDMTTDHISPAGAINPNSEAGQWLLQRGAKKNNLNVYASYRGNWEVMLRGLFTNTQAINCMGASIPPAYTKLENGSELPIYKAAWHYEKQSQSCVILAGERYGMGSSRDWAAKGVALLGVRAVIARSFERIHRTNLIGMGILPIQIIDAYSPKDAQITAADRFEIDVPEMALKPQLKLSVDIVKPDGMRKSIACCADVHTHQEVATLRMGGILPSLLKNML